MDGKHVLCHDLVSWMAMKHEPIKPENQGSEGNQPKIEG